MSPIFYSDTIRDIIIAYKFNGQRAYSDILSYILCDLLKDMQHLCEFDCVIPMPLSKKRMNERGFNQSALLAKPLADCLGVPYRDDILFRIRETKRQSRIKISERTANVQNAFEAAEDLQDKRILLVDDIFTTGNTMNACAEALKQREAKNIVGIALTRRDKHENIFNLTY
ncbi:MAG: hypothetical protein LIO59_06285 [Oscillospiraceae bacterium]|nr:hypothetical protein [Oscillospiraceae bacterium]